LISQKLGTLMESESIMKTDLKSNIGIAEEIIRTGGGAIVNMSAGAGVRRPQMPIYSASKHAVLGLTKSAALEYAKSGIRINAGCCCCSVSFTVLMVLTLTMIALLESSHAVLPCQMRCWLSPSYFCFHGC
jgi:NAD(P)-dependent dehydrogenase (short-subunit alcohol dehydrogenase family)